MRTALALSTLTGKPFRVTNIRKNRPGPGLKAQHLAAINALKQLCDAKAYEPTTQSYGTQQDNAQPRYAQPGDTQSNGSQPAGTQSTCTRELSIGSTCMEYVPGKLKGGSYSFDIGTAGSISLVLQAVLPPILFAPKKVKLTLTGGTCGLWQAPVEYFQHVLLPHIRRFCDDIACTMAKRGYYPKGGGKVILEIKPKLSLNDPQSFNDLIAELQKKVKPIILREQGELVHIGGISHAAQTLSDKKVAERQADIARMMMQNDKSGAQTYASKSIPQIQSEYQETLSTGSGITLWARFNKDDEFHTVLGADALGERRKRAEDVGKEAAQELLQLIHSGATMDKHMTDQLLPFLALLPGSEAIAPTITEHARTNMVVIERFLDVKFHVEGNRIIAEE